VSKNTYDVCVAFAERATPKKGYNFRNSRGNVYTDTLNTEIFSYGTHFTMAIAYDDKKLFLVNGDTYSRTTAQHQSSLRGAVQKHKPDKWQIIILPFSSLRAAGIDFSSIDPIEILTDREIGYCNTCDWRATEAIRYIKSYRYQVDEHRADNPEHDVCYEHRLGESVFTAKVTTFGGWGRFTFSSGWRKPKGITRKVMYFISGFDTTANRRGGYFLSVLPRKVTSVDDAYEALKPKEVIEAEAKGIKVLRQGDIFAIPTDFTTAELKELKHKYTKAKREDYPSTKRIFLNWYNKRKYAEEYAAQLAEHSWYIDKKYFKVERPEVLGTTHTVSEMITIGNPLGKGETYARGSIRHNHNDNRPPEHRVVNLAKGVWYRIVRNTSLGDWAAAGNVD
jgi:hypothetical protein